MTAASDRSRFTVSTERFARSFAPTPTSTLARSPEYTQSRTDTETGLGTFVVGTSYQGALDCISQILKKDGPQGFFKGAASLIWQYTMHMGVLLATWYVYSQLGGLFADVTMISPPAASQTGANGEWLDSERCVCVRACMYVCVRACVHACMYVDVVERVHREQNVLLCYPIACPCPFSHWECASFQK